MCNDLAIHVLTPDICADALKQQSSSKPGSFCRMAMEKGFKDSCLALCVKRKAEYDIAATCRAAATELPRPAVRRWCEHGYREAFYKTSKDLAVLFERTENHGNSHRGDHISSNTNLGSSVPQTGSKDKGEVYYVTHGGEEVEVTALVGQSHEDAVLAFCQYRAQGERAQCIREILPQVLPQEL